MKVNSQLGKYLQNICLIMDVYTKYTDNWHNLVR